MSINNLTGLFRSPSSITSIPGISPQPQQAPASNKASFSQYLEQEISQAERYGIETDEKIAQNLRGELNNPHELVIAMQKADISFKLLLNVKDKIEQAYQQLVRTQVG